MSFKPDVLVIGAGFAGAVCARALADRGKRALVLERRGHVGGNAYDCFDEAGIRVHKYGPHIFHTNDKKVFDWLSRFTSWRPYEHRVAADIPRGDSGRLQFPVPFNLDSVLITCGPRGPAVADKLVRTFGAGTRTTVTALRENGDPEIAALADHVYAHVFLGYTMKQWGRKPEEIDPGTIARVPVLISHDDRYFQDAYQGMPGDGYTEMFYKILGHPSIRLDLETDALDRLAFGTDAIYFDGIRFDGPVVYTGETDRLFGYEYGPLPYRTLDLEFETLDKTWFQAYGTVNYTMDQRFTRITEFKHLTGQRLQDVTTILREYPRAYDRSGGDIPYYPVTGTESAALYGKYARKSEKYANLRLLGRLAEYKYYDMDAITGRALALAGTLHS